MREMTPRERVLAVLRGEPTDKVPFTIYENKVPQCAVERRLRNEGLCILYRDFPPYRIVRPNCVTETFEYLEEGRLRRRIVTRTPVGEVFEVVEPADYTAWRVVHPFKSPEDYKVLRFIEEDTRVLPCYEEFEKAQALRGDDMLLRADVGGNPLHRIMYLLMDMEAFAVEWAENRDEVLALAEAMRKNVIATARVVADSPSIVSNLGGNETPMVMGPGRYREYCIPLINEVAALLEEKGKFLGSHMDGNNRAWAKDLAGSGLHIIEAFSPAPDTDMTMAEAVAAWPDKAIWINFPSTVHLSGIEKVKEKAREILQAAAGHRLIIGVTEDIHPELWQQGLLAVSEVINEQAR
jgi:uroporphyrinogen-III decarboxylase